MEEGIKGPITVTDEELVDYLLLMRKGVQLTPESVEQLRSMHWDNPVSLVQFVYGQGFIAAVDHLLQRFSRNELR